MSGCVIRADARALYPHQPGSIVALDEVTGGIMAHTWKKSMLGRVVAMALLSLVIAACATTTRNATSVVDYLYPDSNKAETPSVPVLTLPLRVAIAFTPGDSSVSRSGTSRAIRPLNLRSGGQFILTEKKRQDLMQEVANHFKKYPFVKDIEIIPSAYLSPRGSFANLDQIKTMYGERDRAALIRPDAVHRRGRVVAHLLDDRRRVPREGREERHSHHARRGGVRHSQPQDAFPGAGNQSRQGLGHAREPERAAARGQRGRL